MGKIGKSLHDEEKAQKMIQKYFDGFLAQISSDGKKASEQHYVSTKILDLLITYFQ